MSEGNKGKEFKFRNSQQYVRSTFILINRFYFDVAIVQLETILYLSRIASVHIPILRFIVFPYYYWEN